MKHKFCPQCGKETNKLFDGICESCLKKEKFVELPKEIKISVCKNCSNVIGTKEKFNDNFLIKLIKNNLHVNGKLKSITILEKNEKIKLKVKGLLKGYFEKEEFIETKIVIKKRLCETCGKVKGGYYEAVIQIRSENKDKLYKTYNLLIKEIEKEGGLISKIDKNIGIDIYFTPKKILRRIVKRIPHPEEIKKSYTLVTKKDGKNVYRNTVLIRV